MSLRELGTSAKAKLVELTAVWARELMSGGQAEAVHCHMLFHLPPQYRSGSKLLQLETAIYRLIKHHGRDYWADQVFKLVIHDKPPYPDGKYLIKGGGPKVWKGFHLRKEHRRLQGLIHGKRCGTTENIGKTARDKNSEASGKPYQSTNVITTGIARRLTWTSRGWRHVMSTTAARCFSLP
jgi:hypothetical protein